MNRQTSGAAIMDTFINRERARWAEQSQFGKADRWADKRTHPAFFATATVAAEMSPRFAGRKSNAVQA